MPLKTITKETPLVLASASDRRRILLEQVRIPFRTETSSINEKGNSFNSPEDLGLMLARSKALEVFARTGPAWTLGADTLVVINNHILGKPDSSEEAHRMLQLLSGSEHRVITGFCIIDPTGAVSHSEAVTTNVRIKKLGTDEIDGYIRSGEPYGKAGSYAVQGLGSFMVEEISGSYTNVVGLPLCALIKALLSSGALEKFPLF